MSLWGAKVVLSPDLEHCRLHLFGAISFRPSLYLLQFYHVGSVTISCSPLLCASIKCCQPLCSCTCFFLVLRLFWSLCCLYPLVFPFPYTQGGYSLASRSILRYLFAIVLLGSHLCRVVGASVYFVFGRDGKKQRTQKEEKKEKKKSRYGSYNLRLLF